MEVISHPYHPANTEFRSDIDELADNTELNSEMDHSFSGCRKSISNLFYDHRHVVTTLYPDDVTALLCDSPPADYSTSGIIGD